MNYNYLKAKCYNNMGIAYQMLNQYDKALKCYKNNIRISKKINRTYGASLLNIGEIYFNQKKYKEALKYYDLTMEIEKKVKNRKYSLSDLYFSYAQVYYSLNQTQKALEYAKRSLQEASNFNLIYKKIDPANLLRKIFIEKKDFKNAIAMGSLVIEVKDSMKIMSVKEQISELKITHRLELEEQKRYYEQKQKKQKEELANALLMKKKKRKKIIQYTGIFIFILFLFTILGFAKKIPLKYFDALIFFNFLLLFEFLLLFVDSLMSLYETLNTPLFKLLFNVMLALLIIPIHSFLEKKLKRLSTNKSS